MTINIVHKWAAPAEPWTCELVALPIEAIPFVLGGNYIRSQKYWWETSDDAIRGRQLINLQGANMLLGCTDKIVEAIDRQTRLLDVTFNGRIYVRDGEGTEADPFTYSPDIPDPMIPEAYAEPGMHWKQDQTHDMTRNAITGIASGDFVEVDATNPLLIQIRDLLQEESDEETIALLQAILSALGGAL